ncbi:uncharacterized protein LOC118415525 isoform X1 [Branchiostoma floridae]|uniref:Uncharacterized protein LOC118415525 isoform X1 n=1 Tax=Branchiostoma floridae TaxID=7739 RepID=A0A9J7L4V7_BRAFL|nr:uncharacterized protein LOC118415525 isoform X1 [Branchiostoma floridae]
MVPAIIFPLVFYLASAAEDHVATLAPKTLPTLTPFTTMTMPYPTTTTATMTTTLYPCTCCRKEQRCTFTTTTRPLPCLLRGRSTCLDPPCVDQTSYNSYTCSCGTCPTGPNCYAWDRTIIPAGEAVEVNGAVCECRWKRWGDRFSPYADCRWGVISG